MEAGEYVFAPLKDPIRQSPEGRREEWDGKRTISNGTLLFTLKMYAEWAGLRPELISFQALRNTGVMLRLLAGESEEEVGRLRGHGNPDSTENYIRNLRRYEKKPFWANGKTARRKSRLPLHGHLKEKPEVKRMLAPPRREEVKAMSPEEGLALLREVVQALQKLTGKIAEELLPQAEDRETFMRLSRIQNRTIGQIKRMNAIFERMQGDEKEDEREQELVDHLIELEESMGFRCKKVGNGCGYRDEECKQAWYCRRLYGV
jgi:hypothetical protein